MKTHSNMVKKYLEEEVYSKKFLKEREESFRNLWCEVHSMFPPLMHWREYEKRIADRKKQQVINSPRHWTLDRMRTMIDELPEDGNECKIWNGSKYPQIFYGGKCIKVTKLVYKIYKGILPRKKFVCHSCDNPYCVNPDHLWLGTRKDNSRDMVRKGRSLNGEKHPHSKLSNIQREEIKKKAFLIKARLLAEEYKITPHSVRTIKKFWNCKKNKYEIKKTKY